MAMGLDQVQPAAPLDFLMIDADHHYYEPDDCFTRHMESAYADRAVNIRRGEGKFGRVYIGDERMRFFSVIPGDHTGGPGALQEFLKSHSGEGDGLVSGETVSAATFPESTDSNVRLRKMNEQGVEAALMLPTLGVGIAHELRHEPQALFANLRAFNRWLEEDWSFGKDGRLYGIPVLSLVDIDLAVAELERVLALGARSVNLTPGPVNGHSPADPLYDPFWARCQEAGIPVVFHLGNDGLTEIYSSQWSENPSPPSHRLSPFQRVIASTERATADTLSALVFHNLFGRFPSLQVVSIENGATWIAPLLKAMDHAARLSGPRDWTFGHAPDRPSEIFKRHIKVSPFPEEDIPALVEVLGPENVLAGSDWPHPEGCAEPIDYVEGLEGLSPEVVRAVMRDNTQKLFGV